MGYNNNNNNKMEKKLLKKMKIKRYQYELKLKMKKFKDYSLMSFSISFAATCQNWNPERNYISLYCQKKIQETENRITFINSIPPLASLIRFRQWEKLLRKRWGQIPMKRRNIRSKD